MPTKDQFTELAVALSWDPIVSKNQYMISFKRNDERMNYYFTSGTVTIQSENKPIITKRDITLDTLEQSIL
jgi:hypothetical protein